jgi:hypothetical protein
MLLGAGDTFLVEPSRGLIVWTVYAVLALGVCAVTVTKGRYGWFLVGLASGGLGWFIGALLAPTEASAWTRLRRRSAKP